MDCFKKIAKYSFISSNIVSSLAMNKINENNDIEIKFNSVTSLGTFVNKNGEIFERKTLKNCYLASDKLKNLNDLEIKCFDRCKNNIEVENKEFNKKISFFHLLFKYKNGNEENYIINIEEINKFDFTSLSTIFEEKYGKNIRKEKFSIYCLFSNNNGKDINIKRGFFSGLLNTYLINIRKLDSFKYENIMSSFNVTAANKIILPNNLKTNDFTDIDMNSNDFAYKFYYFAKTYNLNINEVFEEYYKFSNGIISNEMIGNFENHLKAKKSEKSEK